MNRLDPPKGIRSPFSKINAMPPSVKHCSAVFKLENKRNGELKGTMKRGGDLGWHCPSIESHGSTDVSLSPPQM